MAEHSLITDSASPDTQAPGNGTQSPDSDSTGTLPAPPEPARITGPQCRAARAMLGWSREELAERSSLHYITLCNFELGHNALKPASLRLLRLTFVSAGLLFIDADAGGGPGVCLAKAAR
ncbi:helix-turn-helix domain-containing protein [Pelagibius sp.]|uniref:helix-turn-helix domain-containing protein n=1 Tax=Pelagibius sp. TaxID=1931238 RepID=UPI003B50722E